MDERSAIDHINQVTKTRRIAYGMVLLALALPVLFAMRDDSDLYGAVEFSGKLAAVTLLAQIARHWVARHYSPGVQVQALLAFALLLLGWSGYVSRVAYDARVQARNQAMQPERTVARIPAPDAPAVPPLAQRR